MIIPERWVQLSPSILSNNTDQDIFPQEGVYLNFKKIHIELLEGLDSSYVMDT